MPPTLVQVVATFALILVLVTVRPCEMRPIRVLERPQLVVERPLLERSLVERPLFERAVVERPRDKRAGKGNYGLQCKFVTLGAQAGPKGQYAWSYSYPIQQSNGQMGNNYVNSYLVRN